MVADKFGFHRDPITSRLARAQKRLDDCAAQVQIGREAFRASQWDPAYHAAVAALDLVFEAQDRLTAVRTIRTVQPDAAIIDVKLDMGTGFRVVEEIRNSFNAKTRPCAKCRF